jgi:hypothetical protein
MRIGIAVVASTGARFTAIQVIVALVVRIVVDPHINRWETRPTAVPCLMRLGRHCLLLTNHDGGARIHSWRGARPFAATLSVPHNTHTRESQGAEKESVEQKHTHTRTHTSMRSTTNTHPAQNITHTHTGGTHTHTWTKSQGYRGKAVMARRIPRRVLPCNLCNTTPECGCL